MKNETSEERWILLWVDKNILPKLISCTSSFWQKVKQAWAIRLRIKTPTPLDVIELEASQITASSSQELDFLGLSTKLSKQLQTHHPQEVYKRFGSTQDFKSFIIQVAGEIYYPMWAPSYIRSTCRFLLNLPEFPRNLRKDLEIKLQLPDQAIQQEFATVMNQGGSYTFFQPQWRWAKGRYPGIDKDFEEYIKKQKPGVTAQVNQQEYFVAQFGHPERPELWVYFPTEARNALPPPNGHIYGKVIGIISYNWSPPLPGMPTVYLSAACLFGKTI